MDIRQRAVSYTHLKPRISVETASGIKYLDMKVENGKVTAVTVDMGKPVQTSELFEELEIKGKSYRFIGISMGNQMCIRDSPICSWWSAIRFCAA